MFAAIMPRSWFAWRRLRAPGGQGRRKRRFLRLFHRLGAWRRGRHQRKSEYKAARLIIRLSDVLVLDNNQRDLLTQLLDELFTLRAEVHKERSGRKNELVALLDEPRFDRQRAMALVREKTRAIDERAAEIVMALAEFSDSLEPEQRKKLHGLVEHAFFGRC